MIGHRGAAGVALENTLEAFACALAPGVAAVETDVQLTADGELVVFHDRTLERLAPTAPPPLRASAIEELERSALERIGLGPTGASRVPRLAEVLACLPAGMPLNVEVKRWRAAPGAVVRALALTLALPGSPPRPILLSSFDWDLLAAASEGLPEVSLAVLDGGPWSTQLGFARQLGAVALCLARERLAESLLAAARAARLPLLVYAVNDPREALALFARGVSGVFSDHPARLGALLAGGEAGGANHPPRGPVL